MPAALGLDHILVRVHDLDALLALFHGRLGLPMLWPLRDEPFARYAWVNAGNVGLEFWQARSDADLPAGTVLPCLAGVGLWPADVHASRAQLVAEGVACRAPKAWHTPGPDGAPALNFTNCLVSDASAPGCEVFFCEWDRQAPIVPWPKGRSTAWRRTRMADALAACDGGALGLVGLRELHIETPQPAATARVWAAIAGAPRRAAPDVALHLHPGPTLRLAALSFGVRDLARAHAALQRLDLPAVREERALRLDPGATFGLRIGLVGA